MNKISLPKASQLTSPNPLALVCTKRPDGGTNIATVSWWTYLSFNPSTVGYAMAKTSYSGERVRENKEVLITIPGSALAEEAMKFGTTTGHDTDKVAVTGIEMQDIEGTDIKAPLHSKVVIRCKLKDYVETGDHYFYVCDVEDVLANEDEEALFAWKGYAEIRTAK